MVLGWFQTPMSRERANSFSQQTGNDPRMIHALPVREQIGQAEPENAPEAPRPRRQSIFQRRVSLGSDPFSREYADQMEDLWVAECEQGDSAHVSKGHLRSGIFNRRIPLGSDEFSREYFDSMEDTFVAESDMGDSGYLRRNSMASAPDMEAPDLMRRIGEMLRRPVHVGRDTFSQEYAREFEDMWQSKSGKGPSGYYQGQIARRVMDEYKPEDGTDWSKIRNMQENEQTRRRSIFSS